jgi:hypothetical protein
MQQPEDLVAALEYLVVHARSRPARPGPFPLPIAKGQRVPPLLMRFLKSGYVEQPIKPILGRERTQDVIEIESGSTDLGEIKGVGVSAVAQCGEDFGMDRIGEMGLGEMGCDRLHDPRMLRQAPRRRCSAARSSPPEIRCRACARP